MNQPASLAVEEFVNRTGREIGLSRWFKIDQARIDNFAELVEDRQFIHLDAGRARSQTPFGGTVAHGFLTMSLLSAMLYDAVPEVKGQTMGVNYGFDRLRFLAPVPAGSKVRGRFSLISAEEQRGGELTLKFSISIEIEGAEKPALAAEWLTRHYFDTDD